MLAVVLSSALLQTESCEPAGNARLAVLELWVGAGQGVNALPEFEPNGLFYLAQLAEAEDAALLRVEPEAPTASIEVLHDGDLVPLSSAFEARLDVPPGRSGLRIKVTVDTEAGQPYSWTYTVFILRGGSGFLFIDIDVSEVARDGGSDGGQGGVSSDASAD